MTVCPRHRIAAWETRAAGAHAGRGDPGTRPDLSYGLGEPIDVICASAVNLR
jgi:hypothetical protein